MSKAPSLLTRRRFIKLGGPSLVAAATLQPAARTLAHLGELASSRDRTLVVIQLKGGNDWLNTVIPVRDERYFRLRPTLAIRAHDALLLTSDSALHPACEALMPLFRANEMAIVRGVGFSAANGTHTQANRIWNEALSGELGMEKGPAASPSGFSDRLQELATAIARESRPSLHRITLDGFDTHVHQAAPHASLLKTYSEAMSLFQTELRQNGCDPRVVTLTYSEFGRAAEENENRGTDHGSAGAVFVIGRSVQGGLHGSPFDLGLETSAHQPVLPVAALCAQLRQQWLRGAPQVAHQEISILRFLRTT